MIRALLVALILALPAQAEEVDVELALLVDVSRSMAPFELEIQRRGYAEALVSPQVLGVIGEGFIGRIAVTYIEWAGAQSQRVVVDWTTIAGAEDAQRVADQLLIDFGAGQRRTSISGAIDTGARAILSNRYEGLRQVIDVSGDGPNNQGAPVTEARDRAVAQGIVINGLPLLTQDNGGTSQYNLPDLDRYYVDCVIGGPGAFAIPVTSWEEFPAAVRRKLIMEIAGLPPGTAIPDPETRPIPAAGYDCRVGEKIWERGQDDWRYP